VVNAHPRSRRQPRNEGAEALLQQRLRPAWSAKPRRFRDPRGERDVGAQQAADANGVMVDDSQVLASFQDAMVVVGGWVPDLLPTGAIAPHVTSIDVDLVFDAASVVTAETQRRSNCCSTPIDRAGSARDAEVCNFAGLSVT
jgi:hypothetical protein